MFFWRIEKSSVIGIDTKIEKLRWIAYIVNENEEKKMAQDAVLRNTYFIRKHRWETIVNISELNSACWTTSKPVIYNVSCSIQIKITQEIWTICKFSQLHAKAWTH